MTDAWPGNSKTSESLEPTVLQPAADMAKQNASVACRFRVQSLTLVITGILCLLELPLSRDGTACVGVALPSLPDPHSQYNRHFRKDSAVKLESFRHKGSGFPVARRRKTGHCRRMPGRTVTIGDLLRARGQRPPGLRAPRPAAFFLACSNSSLLIAPSPSLSAPFSRSAILSGNSSTPTLPSPFRSKRLNI